jgi:hypothetical protein
MTAAIKAAAESPRREEKRAMQHRSNMLKVLCPVEGRNGKTIWIRIGNAFINRDGSTNVYLDAYPTSGKLQIRPFDEHPPSRERDSGTADPVAAEPRPDELPF